MSKVRRTSDDDAILDIQPEDLDRPAPAPMAGKSLVGRMVKCWYRGRPDWLPAIIVMCNEIGDPSVLVMFWHRGNGVAIVPHSRHVSARPEGQTSNASYWDYLEG